VSKRFPKYPSRAHQSGQARIRLGGKDAYLGVYNSPESWAEYNRLLDEWRAAKAQQPRSESAAIPIRIVRDLVDAWEAWAERTQRDHAGQLKKEVINRRYAYRPLVAKFGIKHVRDFGTPELLELLEVMASGSWLSDKEKERYTKDKRPIGWARSHVNHCLGRVKALFAWGELHGHVPKGKAAELVPVKGLVEGESGVRELDEVPPVDETVLAKTLPLLRPVMRAVCDLLLLTGARPSELLALRPCDIQRGGIVELAKGYRVQLPVGIWFSQPKYHKTRHKGARRIILFGPRAQTVLAPYLDGRPVGTCLFSPAEALADWLLDVRPNHTGPHPLIHPGERYDVHAVTRAINRACKRAGVPVWSSYQLRHNAGTRLADEFNPDIARVILGHKEIKTTVIYALDALRKAAEAVKEAG
jgi:integrase